MDSDGVGDLAMILTQGTNDLIQSLIPTSSVNAQLRPWIGGLQVNGPEPKGVWVWTPDFNLNIFDKGVFNNFATNSSSPPIGEPNNLGGDENCLQMRVDGILSNPGQWNDNPCYKLFPYICVRPSTAP